MRALSLVCLVLLGACVKKESATKWPQGKSSDVMVALMTSGMNPGQAYCAVANLEKRFSYEEYREFMRKGKQKQWSTEDRAFVEHMTERCKDGDKPE